MRIRSEGDVPRIDLSVLRRFVPALWAEWAALRFDAEGRLLDPGTGDALSVLRLSYGVHRSAGARYAVSDGSTPYTFTVTEDNGRTLRGTVTGPLGTVAVALGHQVEASGHGTLPQPEPGSFRGGPSAGDWTLEVTTGDWWRVGGTAGFVAPDWSLAVTFGERWQATARADVRALLLASEVPQYAVGLVGGREATMEVFVEPAMLHRRGDLLEGRARAQRVAADGAMNIQAKREIWRCRITLDLHGRGVLGRSALLAARPAVRRAAREGFTEFWAALAAEATKAKETLAGLGTGEPATQLHQQLWDSLRAADRDQATQHEATDPATADADGTRPATRPNDALPARRRRGRRRTLLAVPAGFSILIVVLVVAIVAKGTSSNGDGSPDPELTSSVPLHVRHVAVPAFAGSDLAAAATTAAIDDDATRLVPENAADDLTGRAAGTIWNTATTATAPDGTTYTVFLAAVDLKVDSHHPTSAPSFTAAATPGLPAGWRSTNDLGPFTGPPFYPTAATLTGNTLLIIHLDIATGAAAELRRLTSQLTPALRQRYLTETRPRR